MFKASDSDREDQNNDGDISPLHKETHPELYEDAPTTRTAESQEDTSIEIEIPGRAVYAEETDVEVGTEEGRVVKEIRFPSDNEDDYKVPGPGPESEDGTEPEIQYKDGEEDESVESSPQREVVYRKTRASTRNQRRRNRVKIQRDQAEKHVKERLDTKHVKMRLGKGASRNTHQKPRTPSTEILSDEDAQAKPQTVSPKSTSMLTRHWKKQPWKKQIKKEVKVRGWEEQESAEEEPTYSDHEEEEDEQDNKVSKNKKNQRQ